MTPVRLSRAQNTNSDTLKVRLDHSFKITNFERHINSRNCILSVDNQPSLYFFFDQNKDAQGEREEEFLELLPCTGLFSDNTDILKIIDNEDDQNQDFEQIELQIGSENIEIAAFDNSEEIIDENEITNSLTKFPDLQYILNQKPISQRQFENLN
ncbi:9443_t:CDS:2 [Funneliformis caledonium]|uniref:9443_t:CDS:1 n=1 Tax=Funneliformis caledonium TaxID=1117310 RepID=A0A9N8WMV0_9GLOM|nr:9443_t:CDS:2 [Funneliformis caledonium]